MIKDMKAYQCAWYKKNKAKHNKKSRENHNTYYFFYRQMLKELVINVYSKGSNCCGQCQIKDIDVLCIDHIFNNGKDEKAPAGYRIGGSSLYSKLRSHGYPAGYQVLCANCNLKKEILRKRGERT